MIKLVWKIMKYSVKELQNMSMVEIVYWIARLIFAKIGESIRGEGEEEIQDVVTERILQIKTQKTIITKEANFPKYVLIL